MHMCRCADNCGPIQLKVNQRLLRFSPNNGFYCKQISEFLDAKPMAIANRTASDLYTVIPISPLFIHINRMPVRFAIALGFAAKNLLICLQ
jgi:hypothetical protein